MTPQRLPNATGDDSDRLNVEFSRLVCDTGYTTCCRDGDGNTQDSRGVDGWSATGLDAASRMWQKDRAKPSTWWRTLVYAGGRRCRGPTSATKRRANEVSPTHQTSITVWRAFICLESIDSSIATVFGPPSTTTMS